MISGPQRFPHFTANDVSCPKRDLEIEGVVLHRVGLLEYFHGSQLRVRISKPGWLLYTQTGSSTPLGSRDRSDSQSDPQIVLLMILDRKWSPHNKWRNVWTRELDCGFKDWLFFLNIKTVNFNTIVTIGNASKMHSIWKIFKPLNVNENPCYTK